MEKDGQRFNKAVREKKLSEKDILHLQMLLAQRRQEILRQVENMESRWQENAEPQIEPEETAQEIELSDPYAPLEAIDRFEVEEIDQALEKIQAGTYGWCEICGQPIALTRLKFIPWTRYCREDAEILEGNRALSS
jgi:DnaK suppressor protein